MACRAAPRFVPRMAGMADRIEEHFRLFNEAVRGHDWTAFLATFTPEARDRLEKPP